MTIFVGSVRLATTVFCAVAASSAVAGGLSDALPQPDLPVGPASIATHWGGYYGGLTFGAAGGDGHATRSNSAGAVIELDIQNGLFPDQIDESTSDLIGGVTFGYNIQRGSFVGGVEFDLSLSQYVAAPDFRRIDPGPLFPGVVTDTEYSTEIDGLTTLRLRGGYATGDTLVYATAGLAAGRVTNKFTLILPNFPGLAEGYASPGWNEKGTRYGYVVGAGVEHSMTDRVNLKAEALYFDLEDVTVEGRDATNFPGQEIDYSFANDGFVLRIGLNVSF